MGRAILLKPCHLATVVLGVALTIVATGSPAAAHTAFESSDPPDGATIEGDINSITISYSGQATPAGEGFVVHEPTGDERTPDTLVSDESGRIWTLGFDPPLPEGHVAVRWRVQAADAHPIAGSFSFEVSNPDLGEEVTGAAAAPADAAASDPAGEATPEVDVENAAAPLSADSAAEREPAVDFEPESLHGTATGTIGRFLGYLSTMLAVGGLLFQSTVLRNTGRHQQFVFSRVRIAGFGLLIGAALEAVAHLAAVNGDWVAAATAVGLVDLISSPLGFALGLRVVSGLLIAAPVPFSVETVARDAAVRTPVAASVGAPSAAAATLVTPSDTDDGASRAIRTMPAVSEGQRLALTAGSAVLLASFAFDGHTVTEGSRWLTVVVDAAHVGASATWAGGVFFLAAILWKRRGDETEHGGPDGWELAVRFSVIAGGSLAVAGLAGIALTATILDSVTHLWTTPWGRSLVAKTVLVAVAAGIGAYNHFVVIPSLGPGSGFEAAGPGRRPRRLVSIEAAVLLLVLGATAVLVAASARP